MTWESIREHYPDQWILLEAIDAYSNDGKRIINKGSVINYYKDSKEALAEYKALHKSYPNRELYVVHTSKKELEILEQKWLGIRI